MRARQGGPVGGVGVALVFHLVVTIVLLVDIRVVSAERERVQLRVSGKSCFYFLLYATCFQSLGRILLSQKSHSSIFLNNTIMPFIWQVCMNFCLPNIKRATFFAYLCCHSPICFAKHSSTRILPITWIFKEKSGADKDQNAKIKVGTKSSNSCQAGLSFQRHSISRGPVTKHNFEENRKANYTRVPRVPPRHPRN